MLRAAAGTPSGRQRAPVSFADRRPARTNPGLASEDIAKAAELLMAARKPVIIVGSGALNAGAEVKRLA